MKGLIATALMILSGSAGAANDCTYAAQVARAIMETRQSGVSIIKSMEIAKDSEAVKAMVLMAYEKPRFSSDRYQAEAASDFETEIYLICVGGNR